MATIAKAIAIDLTKKRKRKKKSQSQVLLAKFGMPRVHANVLCDIGTIIFRCTWHDECLCRPCLPVVLSLYRVDGWMGCKVL